MEGCLCVTQAWGWLISTQSPSGSIATTSRWSKASPVLRPMWSSGLRPLLSEGRQQLLDAFEVGTGIRGGLSSGDTSSRPRCNTSHRISQVSGALVATRLKPQPRPSQSDDSDCLPKPADPRFNDFDVNIEKPICFSAQLHFCGFQICQKSEQRYEIKKIQP